MDEQLIEAVSEFNCLWEVTSKSFKDIKAKENSWKEVSNKVNAPVEVCSRKWKNLRDRFVRELKKVKKMRKTGEEGPPYVPSWDLYNKMIFLQESVRHRTKISSLSTDSQKLEVLTDCILPATPVITDASIFLDGESSTEETTRNSNSQPKIVLRSSPQSESPPPRKRKRGNVEEVDDAILKMLARSQDTSPTDDEEFFGRHISAALRRLGPKQRALAKLQIEQVLVNIEFPND